MARSSKKALQAKKKDGKSRDVFESASSHSRDSLDVSAWFDTRFLIDGETGQCFDDCLSERGWYEKVPPADPLQAEALLEKAEGLPAPDRMFQRAEAFEMLRLSCRTGWRAEESCALLGSYLTRSDDEAEFKEGMAWLEECLEYRNFTAVLESVDRIVREQASRTRCTRALALLERAIKAGSAEAVYRKGLYVFLGLWGEQKQGIKLLRKAGKKGVADAWSSLAEIHLFGLCGIRADIKKALSLVRKGDKRGSRKARFWRLLIEFGVFSRKTKARDCPAGSRKKAARELGALISKNDSEFGSFGIVLDRMLRLGAVKIGVRPAAVSHNSGKPHPERDFEELMEDSVQLSGLCLEALQHCQVSFAAFFAYALKKISRTVYGRFYAGALAARLMMRQSTSAAEAPKVLKLYLKKLPESLHLFSGWAVPEQEDRLEEWRRTMRLARGSIVKAEAEDPDFFAAGFTIGT